MLSSILHLWLVTKSTEVETQLTLRIQFSRDVTLCMWVIVPQHFDATQVFLFLMSKCL